MPLCWVDCMTFFTHCCPSRYNIWSYGVHLFNYLRTSNDTTFLNGRAAKSNLTVDQALEAIVMDWQVRGC